MLMPQPQQTNLKTIEIACKFSQDFFRFFVQIASFQQTCLINIRGCFFLQSSSCLKFSVLAEYCHYNDGKKT